MPRRQEVPRWRRGRRPASYGVHLSGRHGRQFARELARATAAQQRTADANDTLARTGAWRFRYHVTPFAWLAVLIIATAGLRAAAHPLSYAIIGSGAAGTLLVYCTRHLSRFARRACDIAALLTAIWLPILAAEGTARPWPALLAITWAACTLAWVRHYGWRPADRQLQHGREPAPGNDESTWARLAKRNKWSGKLGEREDIPGGRKYPILLDGAETHIGQILGNPRAIAAAWDKAATEAYAEPHPSGIESRGYLTVLKSGTLEKVPEWDGQGITADGFARIGRFADGDPARLRFWVPRDGTRHGLVAGTSGAGKSVLLDLLVWLALTSSVPVVPVILDPQNGQSLPQWRGKVPYAAGLEECLEMLAGLYAGMMDRSRDLARMAWQDEHGQDRQGFEFFDPALTGLPVVMPIIDEAPMILRGGGNAKRAAQAVILVGEMAKLARKTGLSVWLVAQVPSLGELGDQSLRSMLVGGNVVCLRTGDKVSAGMLGLDVDPSTLPKYFPSGEPTGGLGYALSVDNRQAPMRISPVPAAMRRDVPQAPPLDDLFAGRLLLARSYWQSLNADPVVPAQAAAPAQPAEDAPEGRRCADAVWQVLADSAKPMERGEIIKWANELATTGWGREKPFSIRAIGDALNRLVTDPQPGRAVTKVRDGVYQATAAKESQC